MESNISRLRDIIDQHRPVEERLVIANAYLAAIFDNAEEAILAKNLNQEITAWNPAAERLYGYSQEEAVGQSISLIVPLDRREELDLFMKKISKGERIPPFKTKRMRKDGKEIEVILTVSPITDGTGLVIGASAIAHPGNWNDQSE